VAAGITGFTEQGGGSSAAGFAIIYWMTAPSLTVTAGDSVTLTSNLPTDLVVPVAAGGHPVTLSDDPPEVTETFTVGSTTLCNAVPVVDGMATCTTSALPVGTDDVTATLGGLELGSFTVPGSVTLTSHLVSRPSAGAAGLDQEAPWDGTTEVLAVTVSAASVPVPASGAGIPVEGPPIAVILILVGGAGILTTRRQHRAR
jgi:hypothetical protein